MPTSRRTAGRPEAPRAELARGRAKDSATRRFSIEMPDELLAQVDAAAAADDRSRIGEIRALCAEALAARAAAQKKDRPARK